MKTISFKTEQGKRIALVEDNEELAIAVFKELIRNKCVAFNVYTNENEVER